MLHALIEAALPRIIGLILHRHERLTLKELAAREVFMKKLEIKKRKTKKSIIVAFVGLIGSGKSSVAQELAKHIGGTIVEGDAIRVELRKKDEHYERTRAIAEDTAVEIVERGGNAILDSDFVDAKKRASIREKARRAGTRLIFVRTYCDCDVSTGRMLMAMYYNRVDDFFGGASSEWNGDERLKGAVVKMREMWRRTPHHYTWVNRSGGTWVLKKLPFTIYAEIDTTNEDEWRRAVESCTKKLFTL